MNGPKHDQDRRNLKKTRETLSRKKLRTVDFERFKGLLFSGEIDGIVDEVKSVPKVKSDGKIMKKLKSYFVANRDRMRRAANRAMKRPIGSGGDRKRDTP